jgi:hypothetical protein
MYARREFAIFVDIHSHEGTREYREKRGLVMQVINRWKTVKIAAEPALGT